MENNKPIVIPNNWEELLGRKNPDSQTFHSELVNLIEKYKCNVYNNYEVDANTLSNVLEDTITIFMNKSKLMQEKMVKRIMDKKYDKYEQQIILATKGWGKWTKNNPMIVAIKMILAQRNAINFSDVSDSHVFEVLFDIINKHDQNLIKCILMKYHQQDLTSNKAETLINLFIRMISTLPVDLQPDFNILNGGYEYYEKSNFMTAEFILSGISVKNITDRISGITLYNYLLYTHNMISNIKPEHTESGNEYILFGHHRFIMDSDEYISDKDVINASIALEKFNQDSCRIVPQATYRHFKGNLYKVLSIVVDLKTAEIYVLYQALYGEHKYYVRPLTMFESEVDRDKYPDVKQKYRFERIN